MAYKFQLGAAILSGALTQDDGNLSVRDASNNRKFLVDAATGDISGSGLAALDSLNMSSNWSVSGNMTGKGK